MPLQIQIAENDLRQKPYRRNPQLEALLKELNELLSPVETQLTEKYSSPARPVLFIVGAPRSGTTLFLQWLADSGMFGYVSNFNARFFSAPALGAKIQQMIRDPQYAFGKEMAFTNQIIAFSSDLGKTEGLFSPNEFWYFWRRFFPFDEISQLSPEQLAGVEIERFQKEVAALQDVFRKPLVLKAMIINWHIRYLAENMPSARFIFMKRRPFFNIRSLLQSRRKFFGNINTWYSFKPPEYVVLQEMDPFRQVAGQVHYTNQTVEDQLAGVDKDHYIKVQYEDFCQNPRQIWERVKIIAGLAADSEYNGPPAFKNTNHYPGVDGKEDSAICEAYLDLFGEDISPQNERKG